MKPELGEIDASACLVSDGAWGTELQKLGLEPGSSPDSWNAAHPDRVLSVAQAYVDAGARIILTNTFGAGRFVLERHGLAELIDDLNFKGARISREAAGSQVLVFGSMGPTGVMLAAGDVPAEAVYESYRIQAQALHRGGVDALLIETLSDIEEMRLAAEAARASAPLPIVLSMTFDAGRDKAQTMMGVTPEKAVKAMEQAGAWMVGANCGLGPELYVRVCERMRGATSKPIWIKANAGVPRMTGQGVVYPQDPDTFASHALRLRDAGANVIGGCCGTSPEYIRKLSAVLMGRRTVKSGQ